MTPDSRSHEPAGGDGLLFVIATAIVAVVALEGLLIAFSSWWLLGLTLAVVIAAAAGVSAALVRLIDHGTPFARSPAQPEREPEPATEAADAARRAPVARPRVIAH
jgi:phage tail tape-measure protein